MRGGLESSASSASPSSRQHPGERDPAISLDRDRGMRPRLTMPIRGRQPLCGHKIAGLNHAVVGLTGADKQALVVLSELVTTGDAAEESQHIR
jgi:hypothetical protein